MTEPAPPDPTKFRVNLFCDCQADLVVGYGPTPRDARMAAEYIFKRNHGDLNMVSETVTEVAVPHSGGGSHYEEYQFGATGAAG